MSPYLNICLSIGGLGLFVGICRYLWCNFYYYYYYFNEHFHVLLEQSVIVGHS